MPDNLVKHLIQWTMINIVSYQHNQRKPTPTEIAEMNESHSNLSISRVNWTRQKKILNRLTKKKYNVTQKLSISTSKEEKREKPTSQTQYLEVQGVNQGCQNSCLYYSKSIFNNRFKCIKFILCIWCIHSWSRTKVNSWPTSWRTSLRLLGQHQNLLVWIFQQEGPS